jgi:hypothetical protein
MADNRGAWVTVTPKVPTAISATSDATMFVSFRDNGNVAYKFDGQWHRITNAIFDAVNAGDDNSFIADLESRRGNSTVVYVNGKLGTISSELARAIGNDGTTFIYDLGGSTWLYAGGNRSVRLRGGEAVAFA